MIARVEQIVMEDRRLTVKQIAANAGIFVGCVDTILHGDMKNAEIMRNHIFRSASAWPRLLRFVFISPSAFFELSNPRTHIFHVHNATIACLTQLLTNFDEFHATKVEECEITRCSSNVNVAIFSM